MLTTILFARGVAFAALLLMLLNTLRLGRSRSKDAFLLLNIGLMAYVLEPVLAPIAILQTLAIVVAITVPLAFWWFCLKIFLDSNPLRGKNKVLLFLAVFFYLLFSYAHFYLTSINPAESYPGLFYSSYALRIGFLVFALLGLFSQWQADLVTERRSLRSILVGFSGLYILAVLVAEAWLATAAAPLWLETVHAVGLASMFLVLASWLLISEPEALFTDQRMPADLPINETPAKLSYLEQTWMQALNRLLQEDRVYRENGLSIGSLATRLGAPEHRLRRLINKQLGYRNFNDFMNYYRLKDAAAMLKDPSKSELPILTVALECGFSSINPFNRAFKSRFNCTPSEYRAAPIDG